MGEMEQCAGDDNPLGNGGLVTWGGTPVGGSDSIKVPFVSKDVDYVRGFKDGLDRWIEKETWTLHGELINCEGYEELLKAQKELYDIFGGPTGVISSNWLTVASFLAYGGDIQIVRTVGNDTKSAI